MILGNYGINLESSNIPKIGVFVRKLYDKNINLLIHKMIFYKL